MELPYTGLTANSIQSNWITHRGREKLESIIITPPATPEWLVDNDQWLRQEDTESIASEGCFELDAGDFPYHGTCGACGSSETYDAEMNNITAL
jgi:hypothetical protein